MKKFLKIFGIVLGVLLLLLFLAPFLFQNQIKDLVRNSLNENLNAQIAFNDINLSLLRNFPDATVGVEALHIVNNAPFEGDTLVRSEEVILQMSVMELFKGSGEPMQIDELQLNNTLVNIKIDSLGNANYDIAIEDNAPITDSAATGSGFQFDVQHYEINNSEINYFDEGANMLLNIENLDHEGTGDFSADVSTLSTFSTALVSFAMDGTNYLDENKLELKADFEMDLENMKFTFLENEALINQLPLIFEGYVKMNEDNNQVDLTFQTPSSSFKNFLAVIPEEYSKNIEEVETSGDFTVNGSIKGIVDETYIPKMDINISSDNASFKYPDLPKSVENISIAVEVKNETGIAEDTYVAINKLNFRIDQDVFKANGSIRNLLGNMLVDMSVNGTLNLANLEQAYPLELEQDLNGIVNADVTTSFDMNSIENEQYQNVNSSGAARITNFSYSSPEIPEEVKIASASLNFQPGSITLEEMQATTGQTDLAIAGNLQNLMGFMFTDQKLKGDFQVNSDTFVVNDFMTTETEGTSTSEETTETETPEDDVTTGEEAIKIPAFLDAELDFAANRVLYDNIELQDVGGNLEIVNETASLNNITANLFGGNLALNGNISTQQEVPTFNMELALQSIDIVSSFNDLELLQNLAPILEALQGTLTSNIELHGNLNNDFTPQLQTLAGNALAEILGAEVNPEQTPLLNNLTGRLEFLDLGNIDLKDLKTQLTFNNGSVEVQPFDFNVKGVQVTAGGSHGFDMAMDYNVTMEIPAEFLGSEIGGALAGLTAQDLEEMTVPLPIGITGTFQNPSINLNMDQAINNLSQKIIQNQRENLEEKGRNIIGNIITGGKNKQDTTTTGQSQDTINQKKDDVKEAARNILGKIFGGREQEQDTSSSEQ